MAETLNRCGTGIKRQLTERAAADGEAGGFQGLEYHSGIRSNPWKGQSFPFPFVIVLVLVTDEQLNCSIQGDRWSVIAFGGHKRTDDAYVDAYGGRTDRTVVRKRRRTPSPDLRVLSGALSRSLSPPITTMVTTKGSLRQGSRAR